MHTNADKIACDFEKQGKGTLKNFLKGGGDYGE